jgi:1-acyl-sn-glycerol-3-phosphate acyltransferase
MGDFGYYFYREVFLSVLRPVTRRYYSGQENVPATGPALLLSNHISHADPPLIAAKFPRVIHFMADKPLLEIPIVGSWLRQSHVFPIDRTKNDRGAIRTAMARLEAGHIVGIFPERGIRHGKTALREMGGEGELPIGTAALWKMMDVPVIPMVILGSDQIYAWKKAYRRPRVFVRIGPMLPPDKKASREELRDRIARAWGELYDGMVRDYQIGPDELPKSAQERWGQPPPAEAPETETPEESSSPRH